MKSIQKTDDLNFSQLCSTIKEMGKEFPLSDKDKIAVMGFLKSKLPASKPIESSNEINIGDTFVYTGSPRGTGMYVPDIGELFEISDTDDIIRMSIELIERNRGYQKVVKP